MLGTILYSENQTITSCASNDNTQPVISWSDKKNINIFWLKNMPYYEVVVHVACVPTSALLPLNPGLDSSALKQKFVIVERDSWK